MTPRQAYQRHVAALLEEIEERRRRLAVMQAAGALPAGLRDLKAELQSVRRELAAAIEAAAAAPAAACRRALAAI